MGVVGAWPTGHGLGGRRFSIAILLWLNCGLGMGMAYAVLGAWSVHCGQGQWCGPGLPPNTAGTEATELFPQTHLPTPKPCRLQRLPCRRPFWNRLMRRSGGILSPTWTFPGFGG